MTDLGTLRQGIARGDYQIDCAKVADVLAERLLTGRALRLPGEAASRPALELAVTANGNIYFHRREVRRRRIRSLQHA